MKKTILKLLRGDGSEANNTLDRKELRKAACKLHLEIEDKADRKVKFNESISKLESRGKIVIENSVVKLIASSVQCNELAADAASESSTAKEVRKEKKRKAQQLIIDEGSICQADAGQIEEGSKKKKAAKTADDTEKKSKSGDASTMTTTEPNSGDAEPAQLAKKEYPPVEVQTGVNTILLFYAYCVPVMSRGESL
jgi:hypothetical protein